MTFQTKNPAGVKQLFEEDPEYVYVDVRTVEEFEQGHVPGSYNIPILFRSQMGMQPNPGFLAVMKRLFAKEQKIVFG